MQIQTIAIDDEPLALNLVTDYIKKTPFLELVAEFDNPIDAIEFISNNKTELIFLDIQMPDLTGVEFAKTLDKDTKIVFTTAYQDYAIQGFKLNAIDYLLKPFSYEEFLVAAQKAKKQIELERNVGASLETNDQFLFIKSEYKIRRLHFDNILYIEGLKDYIKIVTDRDEKSIMSLTSLKKIEAKLPTEKFMRVHRSYIVNLDKVDTIERGTIVFEKTRIPVSEQYKDKFQEFLNRNFL